MAESIGISGFQSFQMGSTQSPFSAITAAYDALVKILKVESVSAINAKTLEVKFNKEVASLEGLTFGVKRGTSTVVLTPKLSEDKMSVELASSTNLVAGEYTVTVTSEDIAEDANTAKVTVAAQKIGAIEFNSDVLAKTGTGTAVVGFKVLDQYGTDITGSAASLISKINWSANVAVDSLAQSKGVLTIDLAGATDFVANQTILITAVDSVTGTTKSQTFTIGKESAVKTLELGEVVLPKDTTRVYTGSASAATIPVVAKDQYENVLDTAAKLAGITVLSSDSAVVPTIVDVDKKPVINLNTTGLSIAKDVTITVVINTTGQTVTKTVEIVKPAETDVVTLGTLETNVVAATDAANKFVLPITVINQFGETLTAKQIAESGISITGTGSFSGSGLKIETNSTSENYGKIVNANTIGAKGVGTVVVTSATGKTASANFDVKDARKVMEVAAPKKVTTNLVSGAPTNVTYQFKDQYGDIVTASDNTDLSWKVVVTDLTGDAGVITATANGDADSGTATSGNNEAKINNVKVTAATGKAGTAKVAVQLLNASSEVVSQVETTFTVAANNAEGLTYAIEDLRTLYAKSTAAAVDGTDAYAEALTFTAKDAKGNEYAIPNSQIVKVESVKGFFAPNSATAPLGDVTLDAQDNKFVIGAIKIDASGSAAENALAKAFETSNTVTDTLKVTLNTADGVKVLTKEVTLSNVVPTTQELKIMDKAIAVANPYEIDKDAKEVTSLTFADLADTISGAEVSGTPDADKVFVTVKDQYGVYKNVAKDFILNSVGLFTFGDGAGTDKFATTSGGAFKLTDANANSTYAAGKDITLSAVDGDVAQTLKVKINAIADVSGGVASPQDSIAAAGTSTITFTRGLSKDARTAIETEIGESVAGVAKTDLSYSWNANNTVITITNNHASTAATFAADGTVDKAKVIDVFGNVNAADLTLDLRS